MTQKEEKEKEERAQKDNMKNSIKKATKKNNKKATKKNNKKATKKNNKKAINMLRYLQSTTAARAMTYGYANARSKSMKASLLDIKDFETLAECATVKEILGQLEKTSYKSDLVEESLKYSDLNLIEIALGKNYTRVAKKLIKICPKSAEETLLGVLSKWDANNLKTILVSKFLGKSRENIEPYIVKAGKLTDSELNKLMQADSVENVVGAATSEYQAILQPLIKVFRETKEITTLLQALDYAYMSKLPNLITGHYKDDKVILGMLKADVDSKNIINIFRAKRDKLHAKKINNFIIPGGNLTDNEIKSLTDAESIEAAVDVIKSKYDLSASLEEYKKDYSLVHFENSLEKVILEKGLSTLRRSNLSIGSIIGFLYLKESEISNIRKIARAKEFSLDKEQIMKMVVLI